MELTQERLKELLHYDPETGVFTWLCSPTNSVKQGRIAGRVTAKGRIDIVIKGKRFFAHRLAWLYQFGCMPLHSIDHIDGNPINNAIRNLRDIPTKDNSQNRMRPNRNNTSGVLGVSRASKNRWRADISLNNRLKYLGSFPTKDAAHEAYVKAKRELHPGNTM